MKLKQENWLKICLFAAAFVLIGMNNVKGATGMVQCSTTVIRPGDFLQIRVIAEPQATVTLKFLDQTKQLYPTGTRESFDGLVAASYRTNPGEYPLTVEIKTARKTLTETKTIEVLERQFVEQRIKVAEKMRRATATNDKLEADAKVGVAVREKAECEHTEALWAGCFILPVKAEKTSDFGQIRYVNDIEHGRHSGWDLAAAAGTPVAAMNRGRVVFAGKLYSSGNTVIIYHGLSLYTSYAHLAKISVKEGSMAEKGQTVGKVGMTGLATGPHLHLTVRVGEIPVDPALLVNKKIEWID